MNAADSGLQLSSDMEMEAYHHHRPFPLAFQLRHLSDSSRTPLSASSLSSDHVP
jgi:hypothetical protein